MAEMTLLETSGLIKRYSGRAVVNEISVTIAQRSIVALCGRNGAGKTTTFRMIMGMITPDSGSVFFDDQDIDCLIQTRRDLGVRFEDFPESFGGSYLQQMEIHPESANMIAQCMDRGRCAERHPAKDLSHPTSFLDLAVQLGIMNAHGGLLAKGL